MNELKNYGFVPPVPNDEHYVLGGLTSLPKIVLQPDGNWSDYLPTYEPQFGAGWDTNGCTVWGTENAIETILKKITGIEQNFSERYIYILAGVRPPGADPHKIAETIRSDGLINQDLLPMTDTFEEFVQPDPMPASYLVQGQLWPYELGHEWLWPWGTKLSAKDKKDIFTECLKYSPLGVSVTAWFEKDGLYVDKGRPNTHWGVLYNVSDRGYEVFDSYDQSRKTLSFDHNIGYAKRYLLTPRKTPKWWWIDIIQRVYKAIFNR